MRKFVLQINREISQTAIYTNIEKNSSYSIDNSLEVWKESNRTNTYLSFVKSSSSLNRNNVEKLFLNRIFVNGLSFSGFTCFKFNFVFHSYTEKESSLSLDKYVTRRDGFEFKKRWHMWFHRWPHTKVLTFMPERNWCDHNTVRIMHYIYNALHSWMNLTTNVVQ